MRLLRLGGLLFIPALLHAGFLNIQASATCGTTTITASFGSAACSVLPDVGFAMAGGRFDDTGASVLAAAVQYQNDSPSFKAVASLQAEYEITFSGAEGPGYMEPTLCAQDSGAISGGFASLTTPGGSVSVFSSSLFCLGPTPPLYIPIVFGVPMDVQLSLQAYAGPTLPFAGSQKSAHAKLDYRVLDATKNPVPFTVEVVIPEPSTWQLWMVGACLLTFKTAACHRSHIIEKLGIHDTSLVRYAIRTGLVKA